MRGEKLAVMKLKIIMVFAWVCAVGLGGCGGGSRAMVQSHTASTEYSQLLSRFPEDDQGFGLEFQTSTATSESETYGLVLYAETLHYKATGSTESRQRVIQATRWLMDHADADGDGKPGWGFAHAWDAFGDGSVNPENQPYTITTALVIQALLESVSVSSLWTQDYRKEIYTILSQVAVRWAKEAWSPGFGGGYYWYSTSPADSAFVINVSAGMTGVCARLLSDPNNTLNDDEAGFLRHCNDAAAAAVVSTVEFRDNCPYWKYIYGTESLTNDLLHHVYTIWGMELYRSHNGQIPLTWSTSDAVKSLEYFWRGGHLYEWPSNASLNGDLKDRPARVWGLGAAIAFEAWKGSMANTNKYMYPLVHDYSNYPFVSIYPTDFSPDHSFYPRFGAHVLWGLAERDFR